MYPSLKAPKNKNCICTVYLSGQFLDRISCDVEKTVYFECSHNALLLHQNVMVFSFSLAMHTPNKKHEYYQSAITGKSQSTILYYKPKAEWQKQVI